jgi:serine/threonine protein kinase
LIQLLAKGGVKRPERGVVQKMYRRFANRIQFQVDQQNSEAIANTYFDAKMLPSTTTQLDLKTFGYAIDGPLHEGSEISFCVRTADEVPEILTLKPLDDLEAERIIAFHGVVCNRQQHPHILPFSIVQLPNKPVYFISPCMPGTIEVIQGARVESAVALWNQISSALDYIHSLNFAHMDVKPSNIFVTPAAARFVLGDLGSIACPGTITSATRPFVPTDFESISGNRFRAAFSIDWWMLAITVLDFVGACRVGDGNSDLSCNRVKELLSSSQFEGKFLIIVHKLDSCQ